MTPREAVHVQAANTSAKEHSFWASGLPIAEAVAFAGARLVGHQQVTDAYLLGLAIGQGGLLATLDERIGALSALKSAERKALQVLS